MLIAKIKPDSRGRITIPGQYLKANQLEFNTVEVHAGNRRAKKDEIILRFVVEDE